MIVSLSPGGQTICSSGFPAKLLLAGTIDGIFAFTRQNGSWTFEKHSLSGEHVSALLYEPRSKILFAATYAGEYEGCPHADKDRWPLYTSRDFGKHWKRAGRGIARLNLFTINYLTLGRRARLYAGTEPAHLYFSDDLGESWDEIPTLRSVPGVKQWRFPAAPHLGHVKHIAFDPLNPDVLYVAIEVGGLLKSVDGGATWRELHGMHEDVHRVVVSHVQPGVVYLSGLEGVSASQDGGVTWKNLSGKDFRIGYPDALVLHPKDETLLYVAGSRTNPGQWRKIHAADSRIARSRDGGKSWEILGQGLPDLIRGNIEAMSMDFWNHGFDLFTGTTDGDIFYSDDGGDRWRKIVAGLPPISKVGHFRNLRAEESSSPGERQE